MKQQNNILDKIERRNPFSTPDNYFDTLSNKLESKIDKLENNKKQSKKESIIWLSIKPLIQFAASIAIIFGISFTAVQLYTTNINSTEITVQDLDEINTEEYDYLMEEIEMEDMYEYLSMN